MFSEEGGSKVAFLMKLTAYSMRISETNLGIFSIGADDDLLFKACVRGEDANEWSPAAAGCSGWNSFADNPRGVRAAQVISLNLL